MRHRGNTPLSQLRYLQQAEPLWHESVCVWTVIWADEVDSRPVVPPADVMRYPTPPDVSCDTSHFWRNLHRINQEYWAFAARDHGTMTS